MKFLVIGLGSMGKRRVRNLASLKAGEVIGFDVSEERRKEAEALGIKTYASVVVAFDQNPDAVIISTPPDLHVQYAVMAVEQGKPFFTELNIVSTGLKEVAEAARKRGLLAAASCDMRYVESIVKIRELILDGTIGKVLAFTYHVGQYLPDWHPWEDYRKFFVAKRETGGCRELFPGELNWLTWIFGDVTQVSTMRAKLSSLEVDIDDVYQVLLSFKKGILGHFFVDVVSRVPYRQLKILGEEGIILWDKGTNEVKTYSAAEKKWTSFVEGQGTVTKGYIHKEEPYVEEMKHFIAAVRGEVVYQHPLEEDLRVLAILEAIEQSARARKVVDVV